tara:strand:+ start:3408 stop:3683 length:276 start_codon:yes stop_codon:yes gene_type:complete
MIITQKKVVTMVDEIQYEAGDVLVCTESDSKYLDVGSNYIVLEADYDEEIDEIRLTDNVTSTRWSANIFNTNHFTCKFEFVLSVKGAGELN